MGAMAIPRTPMTREGNERLKEELDRLKRVERPAIIRAIAEARAHGDLSENAEYHAAREKQGFTEARIKDLEAKMSTAEVIDPPTSGDRVTFGSTVRVEDQDGKETLYQIVGSEETDPTRGRISVMAMLEAQQEGEIHDLRLKSLCDALRSNEITQQQYKDAFDKATAAFRNARSELDASQKKARATAPASRG